MLVPPLFSQTLSCTTSASAPALVLLHGWGSDSRVWDSLLPELRRHFALTLIDLPGHGQSADLLADIDAWCSALLAVAPVRALWLGWSLGATLALAVAARAPERVRSLILVAGTPCFVQCPDWPHAMTAKDFDAFYSQARSEPARALTSFRALQTMGATAPSIERKLLNSVTPVPISGLDLLACTDLRQTYADLHLPVLTLLGDGDRLVPAALAKVLPVKPQASVQVIAGSGHQPFLSQPGLFLDRLLAFASLREAA